MVNPIDAVPTIQTRLRGTVICVHFTTNTFVACKAIAFEVVYKISTNAMDTIHSEALVDVLLTMVTVKTRWTCAKEIPRQVFASTSILTRG